MKKDIHIAIIDDNVGDIAITKIQLQKKYPEAVFITAETKKSFEEKMQWVEPDIVLSDYNLPDCNGLDLLLYVRQHYADIPFVFITGMLNDEEKTAEAILNGANGYILKQNISKVGEKVAEILNDDLHKKHAFSEKRRVSVELSLKFEKLKEFINNDKPKLELKELIMDMENDHKFLCE